MHGATVVEDEISPPAPTLATTRFARTSPAGTFRLDAVGFGSPFGHTDTNVAALGDQPQPSPPRRHPSNTSHLQVPRLTRFERTRQPHPLPRIQNTLGAGRVICGAGPAGCPRRTVVQHHRRHSARRGTVSAPSCNDPGLPAWLSGQRCTVGRQSAQMAPPTGLSCSGNDRGIDDGRRLVASERRPGGDRQRPPPLGTAPSTRPIAVPTNMTPQTHQHGHTPQDRSPSQPAAHRPQPNTLITSAHPHKPVHQTTSTPQRPIRRVPTNVTPPKDPSALSIAEDRSLQLSLTDLQPNHPSGAPPTNRYTRPPAPQTSHPPGTNMSSRPVRVRLSIAAGLTTVAGSPTDRSPIPHIRRRTPHKPVHQTTSTHKRPIRRVPTNMAPPARPIRIVNRRVDRSPSQARDGLLRRLYRFDGLDGSVESNKKSLGPLSTAQFDLEPFPVLPGLQASARTPDRGG